MLKKMKTLLIFLLYFKSVFCDFPPEPRCDKIIYNEEFNDSSLSHIWNWFNEPKRWEISGNKLIIYPDNATDFWSRSYYNFIHNNGHFLHILLPNSENYTIYTKVKIYPEHQFDQAGLMIRYNEDYWIKMAVEHGTNNVSQLGSVVTNYLSDWSTRDISSDNTIFYYRMAKFGNVWVLHAKTNENDEWEQIRISYLKDSEKYDKVPLGIFACSPIEGGFKVEIEYVKFCLFEIDEKIKKLEEL